MVTKQVTANRVWWIAGLVGSFLFAASQFGIAAEAELPPLKELEPQIQSVLSKAQPASLVVSTGGSGVIVTKDGYALTCAHVVGKQTDVHVTLNDGRHLPAKVLGTVACRDLALLKLPDGDYPAVKLGETAKLERGEVVVVLGHPNGPEQGRRIQARVGRVLSRERLGMIGQDAEIIPGDSGSGLLNLNGELVGLNSECLNDVPDNLASDIEVARLFWDELCDGKSIGKSEQLERVLEHDARYAGLDAVAFVKALDELPAGKRGRKSYRLSHEKLRTLLKDSQLPETALSGIDLDGLQGLLLRTYEGGGSDSHGPNHGHGMPAVPGLKARLEKYKAALPGFERDKFLGKLADKLDDGLYAPDLQELFIEAGAKREDVAQFQLAELIGIANDYRCCGHDHGVDTPGWQQSRRDEARFLKQWHAAGEPVVNSVRHAVVELHAGGRTLALGTVVKGNGTIVTKASEVIAHQHELRCRFSDGQQLTATVVRVDESRDLALIQVEAQNLIAISTRASVPAPGRFLVTPDRTGVAAVGIVSGPVRSLRISPRLGIEVSPSDDKLVVKRVMKGAMAEGHLEPGDEVLTVAEKPVNSGPEVLRALAEFHRKDAQAVMVPVVAKRDGNRRELLLRMKPLPGEISPFINDLMISYAVPVSARANGFPLVFHHDQALRADQCGGPVVNLAGEVVGLNIARRNRVEALALPWSEVDQFVQSALVAAQ